MLNWSLIRWTFVCASRHYLEAMLRKELVIPPQAARAFVRDMKAFFRAKGQLMQDEIAAKQAWLLKEHLPRGDEAAGYGRERAVSRDEGSGVKSPPRSRPKLIGQRTTTAG
jgi:hypothetical protein